MPKNKLTEDQAAILRSREIDKQLKSDFKKHSEYTTILLLGTGESGKTTILKQMKIIHINGYTNEEKLQKVKDIRNNIHESIYNIVSNMTRLHSPIILQEKSAQLAADYILAIGEKPPEMFTQEYFNMVDTLWRDGDIQKMVKRASEYHLLDSTEEFMNRLASIRKPDYIPTTQDILYCRVKTTSITNIKFEMAVPKKYGGDVAKFSMIDVGGQRGHRRKWMSVFEGVNTVLFVISVSDFDQTLREDDKTNRLEESLKIFQDMFRSRYLQTHSAIIFLNKEDLLQKKLESGKSIGSHFPSYVQFRKSSDTFVNTKLFIKEEVTARIDAKAKENRNVFIHFTVATSTQNIKHIFDSVHESIIDSALRNIVPL